MLRSARPRVFLINCRLCGGALTLFFLFSELARSEDANSNTLTESNSLDEVIAAAGRLHSDVVITSTPSASRRDSLRMAGDLPAPYDRYVVNIKLDRKTREIDTFWIRVGSKKHKLHRKDASAFPQLDLATLKVEDDAARYVHMVDLDLQPSGLSIQVSIEYGPLQTSHSCSRGLPELVRGRDRLVVSVSNGEQMHVSSRKFEGDLLTDICKERLFDIPSPVLSAPSDSQ